MANANDPLRLDERYTHLIRLGSSIVLVGDEDTRLLESPVAADVVRLVDGRRTAVEIAQALDDCHAPEMVHFALLTLEHGEIVRSAVDRTAFSVTGSSSRPSPEVRIAGWLETAWRSRDGEAVVLVELPGLDLLLALTDDYLHPDLVARTQPETPTLAVRLGGPRVWLGPLVGGENAACFVCLQERLRLNLTGRRLLHDATGATKASSGASPGEMKIERLPARVPVEAYTTLAAALIDLRDVASDRDFAEIRDTLRVLPLDGGRPRDHTVRRLAHCTTCGDPSAVPAAARVELVSRPRVQGSGGGYRTVTPEETLRRYSPLISPLTGVVRTLRRVPVDGTDLIHVYTANHVRNYGTPNLKSLRGDRRDTSGGKGKTDLDARVSALCESLERFSSVHRGTEPILNARRSELGEPSIDLHDLLLFSDRQYAARASHNADDPSGFQWVPERYEDNVIEWSPAHSLVDGTTYLVPSAFVYFAFQGEGRRFCKADSNGLAAGNCLEEAVLQGFLELVERDAIALWWYNRARVPELDFASSDDPYVAALREYYPTLGRSLWALDLTTDLDIPCVCALSADGDGQTEDIIFGFGAHLDPNIALSRALTEVNQMLPTILGSPEERHRQLLPVFRDALDWWETATLEEETYLLPGDQDPTRLDSFEDPGTADLRDDVHYCVDRARSVGCDVLVHDLTRSDVGLAVARVLVPGLRHFWRRLAPGRLYDVPPTLGWTASPKLEEGMNPISMFV